MVLAGDIEATHTRLALFNADHEPLTHGGIAPHILPKLRQDSFLHSLTAKGRFRTMLEQIPVHVIVKEHAGLFGAARIARREPPHLHRTEPSR